MIEDINKNGEKKTTKRTKKAEPKVENTEQKELSYDEMKNALSQIAQQADALSNDNLRLRQTIIGLQENRFYTELNFKFKVLEFAHEFDSDFVERIAKEIEDVMTAKESEGPEDDGEVENPEDIN